MTGTRPKILFLPKWYPNRYDPMPGLFVKNQAEAVSRFCDVAVLYVHEDVDCPNTYEVDFAEEEKLIVVRVYYRISSTNFPVAGNFLKIFRFFKAYWLGFNVLNTYHPDLLHVHVLTRTGLVALLYQIVKKTPYLISEHWSRYFVENNTYKGFLRKRLTKYIVKRAKVVIPVLLKLKEAMLENGLKNPQYVIVPNSVDMDRFIITGNRNSGNKKQMIHVSCFEDKSKNITGFLHVIKELSQKRSDFEVLLIGEGPDFSGCRQAAVELGLDGSIVKFLGQKNTLELASLMANADFLVLSSNYETFGTVIIESLACGTPVVATNVGVVSEVINESNGIIVPIGDSRALEKAISDMLSKCSSYNRAMIREAVRNKYSNESIGKQLYEIYCNILG